MSFGAPKQKPGQQLPAALQPRRQSSGSASKSPKLVNSKQSSSDFGSRNSSASFRHNNNNNNNNHSNQRNHSLTSQGSQHHFEPRSGNRSTTSPPNTTNSNNISAAIRYHSQNGGGGDQHHLFMLRGERYSLISDVLGFADSLLEDDEFDHAHVDFEKEDDPASPLAAALARFGQVPSSSQLSPETYDALAVMERMNHTRRLLESMQVERQECLQHVQRGKEIYKSVFGRSIQTIVDENLRNSSISSSPSPKNNNNSFRRSPGENGDDVDKELEFSLRHMKGEPKLQSAAMSSKNRGKNNSRSPVRDDDDENESESASPLSTSSSSPGNRRHLKRSLKSVIPPTNHGPELKLENVFVRLARTPPKASWVEAAEAAAYTQRYRNQKENEEQENLSAEKKRKSSREIRNRKDTPKKIGGASAMNGRDAVISREQGRIVGKKNELSSASSHVKNSPPIASHSAIDENRNSTADDIDVIPQRFQDPNRKTQNVNESENAVEDISDLPEIIRTPLPPNAWNEAKNLFSVSSASREENNVNHHGNEHDQFYTIDYPSPHNNDNNNLSHRQRNGISFSNSVQNNHDNRDGMMPQMYRSYHPTVNFGSNLEWTGSVRWN